MLSDRVPGVFRPGWRAFFGGAQRRPRSSGVGWFSTASIAMAGPIQSLFLIGALLVGEDGIPGQGTAAIPLLAVGFLLSLAAAPGWTELVLMWPKRVGGIAAACSEALRQYSPVLSALLGTCYWWGWVPTSGLTVVLSSSAIHSWLLPDVPITVIAGGVIILCALVSLLGIRWAARLAIPFAVASGVAAFLAAFVPVATGHVDWHRATNFHLVTPFHGWFGSLTSMMAGLYLIGYAAPAFESAACYVGEMADPGRNVPRAMTASAVLAGFYFIVLPVVLLGALGPHALSRDLVLALGPLYAPLFGSLAKSIAIAFMMLNMLLGVMQPLAGAARTISQLAIDGVLPSALGRRLPNGAPWAATFVTAVAEVALLSIGNPMWLLAAANFTYLISICLPSFGVWLLRRIAPAMQRPYSAPRWALDLGLVAACIWMLSAIFGFEQFGLPTVILGLAFAYAGASLYAWRAWEDQRRLGTRAPRSSLYVKLSGAMLAVLAFDCTGYLIAIRSIVEGHIAMATALEDIFVVVAFLTITVGLVLPGTIAHAATEVSRAANRLVDVTLKDFALAVEALGRGDVDRAHADVHIVPVPVLSRDEVGEMASSFNLLQEEIARAARGLVSACHGLQAARAELVRAKEEAEAGNVAKSHFLAKMSHEIRTPMNGVLSTAELLLASDLTERQRRLATIIQRSGTNLLELINEILDHSKLEAGKVKIEHIDFDVTDVMEEAIDMVAERAAEKKLELNARLPQADRRVNGDPVRVRQVVTNLLSNAVKFTDRGSVSLEATLQDAGRLELQIVVRDTGIGITDEYKQHLFETFSQADDATTRKYGGTGLGLAIVKQIVDLLEGHISVESAVGKGTAFTVRLPMARARSQERVAPDISKLAGVHCLVIGDSAPVRELCRQLDGWQMLVTRAAGENEALARLRVESYPIVVIDAEFNEGNGLRVIERARQANIARLSAFIVTSAVFMQRDDAAMRRLRISDWLYRPLRQSDLYNALVGVADRSTSKIAEQPLPAMPQVVPAPAKPAEHAEVRILVAEDNPVNQEVTAASLAFLGYGADVADNGAAAVAAFEKNRYDVILMDCHMPQLDGFEAARLIRSIEERHPQRGHTPIIAISANAMQDDKECCLAAGMDDHLAKPFKLEELKNKLAHWTAAKQQTSGGEPKPSLAAAPQPAADSESVDWSSLDRIAQLQRPGRPNVVEKIVNGFRAATPAGIDAIDAALAAKNFQRVRENAHKLKSSSANVGATALSSLFRELEVAGAESNADRAAELLAQVRNEYEYVRCCLDEYLAAHPVENRVAANG
jgi:signal transduction histidine kinase/DNA-binding response OmpR family regulator